MTLVIVLFTWLSFTVRILIEKHDDIHWAELKSVVSRLSRMFLWFLEMECLDGGSRGSPENVRNGSVAKSSETCRRPIHAGKPLSGGSSAASYLGVSGFKSSLLYQLFGRSLFS
jgi:hypothetical protein